ncbi:hypothetical protein B7989_02665 [Fibrobacter sp. UWB5]|nr:hypothetical protein B7989_02665 [Fibrobacter sp. UWB5]
MNYGCTLQAFAMQEAYKELGQDPIIIDRFITPSNSLLLGPLSRKGFKGFIKNVVFCIFGCGTFSMIVRVLKTLRFHKKYMYKTPYSFYDWNDAPKSLGVDMISVGSDQIWNANLYSPVPYLLKGIPNTIPGISYAASIGMPELSPQYLQEFKDGFAKFKAISVREKQGVKLVNGLGFSATQVVDPTLLVNPALWKKFKSNKIYKKKRLLCYTLAEELLELLPKLEKFSKDNDCDVVVFPDRFEKWYGFKPLNVLKTQKLRLRLLKSPVKVFISAAIEDFMREISAATWIVTNSYHAMMFSVIYRRNIRIIVPSDKVRQGMHARMQEFEGTIVEGPLMQASTADALKSFEKGEIVSVNEIELSNRIKKSKEWLKSQLITIKNEVN